TNGCAKDRMYGCNRLRESSSMKRLALQTGASMYAHCAEFRWIINAGPVEWSYAGTKSGTACAVRTLSGSFLHVEEST
ncbi:hypothetical protein, partial [Uliginosibacterium flavum]